MSIEKKKKKLEMGRVKLAAEEMQLKIEERLEEIERLKRNIANQETKAKELEEELKTMD